MFCLWAWIMVMGFVLYNERSLPVVNDWCGIKNDGTPHD